MYIFYDRFQAESGWNCEQDKFGLLVRIVGYLKIKTLHWPAW
jgi:hypothetical protein